MSLVAVQPSLITYKEAFAIEFHSKRVTDVGFSDHQVIYCTRKISRIKRGTHKEVRSLSLKNYSADVYEEALG